ncbi:pyrrolidone-carboxylate peptidase [Amycolatopsis sp. NBRC 101858]|uniref:pyroglutamyl-peptidase I n=1 Tax=Amycolatopsis sp. NBRC 101858 TaxID=3032200 RepID=UPI0024A5F16D|nr:pyroglutamyl-peptidase I [Amycolatopsis sp. NBRC 101858]GLY35713.1 pyrrolidone-carboxylate peptidase [Amycolatopsis sp. NBRC 101858]
MARVLVTGFAPFGGEPVNPSWQAVSLLGARRDDIAAVELPCEFAASLPALRAAVAEHRPSLVVCVGQAGGRLDVTPERVAVNLIDARIPDNAGEQPVDVPVVPDGPAAYFTTLPVKACVAAIRAAGVPASVSHTAGTYVCNQVFYGLMHLLSTLPDVRGGFVHVPFSPEQVAASGKAAPSLGVDRIADALEALVDTASKTTEDLAVSAGAEH